MNAMPLFNEGTGTKGASPQNNTGSVIEVKLDEKLKIGGENTFPFYHFEGNCPNLPLIALEVMDSIPDNLNLILLKQYQDVYKDPVLWAQKIEKEYNADLIFLNFLGSHEDKENKSAEECTRLAKEIQDKTTLPLIIKCTGSYEKQNDVLSKIAESCSQRSCILGAAEEKNYRTLVATCMAHNHFLIAESPIDVNIAKQTNILITQMNFPKNRILMDPLTGALGYGLEYTYSVMERIRLQAFNDDEMMQMPFICFVGPDAWKVKETKVSQDIEPLWGNLEKRGILWEAATATSLMLAGANILTLRHPESVKIMKDTINKLKI